LGFPGIDDVEIVAADRVMGRGDDDAIGGAFDAIGRLFAGTPIAIPIPIPIPIPMMKWRRA